jgi:hypothetical protein
LHLAEVISTATGEWHSPDIEVHQILRQSLQQQHRTAEHSMRSVTNHKLSPITINASQQQQQQQHTVKLQAAMNPIHNA